MTIFVHFTDGLEVEMAVPEEFWSESTTYRDVLVSAAHPAAVWFGSGPGDEWKLKQSL